MTSHKKGGPRPSGEDCVLVYLKTSKKGKAAVLGSARAAKKHIVPASPSYKLKEIKSKFGRRI